MNSYLVSYNFFLFCKDYYKTSNKLTRPVQKYLLFFIFWIKFLNTMGITRIWRKSHLGLVVVFYFMKYRRFTDEIQTWNTVVVFYFMKFQTYDHDSLSKPDSRTHWIHIKNANQNRKPLSVLKWTLTSGIRVRNWNRCTSKSWTRHRRNSAGG